MRVHPDSPTPFFARDDERPDALFYAQPRLVQHLDDGAIEAVGLLYDELGLSGDVLDLMSSWVSHFRTRPQRLTVLGMNAVELAANPQAHATVVHDLNADPVIPLPDAAFDAVVNCVSVDYLVRPVEVLAQVRRVLRPGGVSVCTFSNRCFPTKAVRGWLELDEAQRPQAVAQWHRDAGFGEPVVEQRVRGTWRADPLWAVWARRED